MLHPWGRVNNSLIFPSAGRLVVPMDIERVHSVSTSTGKSAEKTFFLVRLFFVTMVIEFVPSSS